MPTEFVKIDYIFTFLGMVLVVNLLTQFTKKLFDRIMEVHTKWVVAGYSIAMCILAGVWLGKFSTGREILETCLIWTINSVLVWFTAMKAYETVAE